MKRVHNIILAIVLSYNLTALAEEPLADIHEIPTLSVFSPTVANEDPAITFPAPVTALRFEALVDLQERNSGEAQGDLVIRGGTFETAGVRIAGASILDPQTGHYLIELPLDPLMLTSPKRLVGIENALLGFNHGSGSVYWDLRKIEESAAQLKLGFGDFRTNIQSAYGAALVGSDQIACDLGASRSESNGTRPNGDHNFARVAGRCQFTWHNSKLDFVLGYQEKSFSWPYLYALKELHDLVGSSGIESESLHTTLGLINYRNSYERGSFIEVAPVYRRNRDNYEFDKFRPGLFNPFEHTTQTSGINIQGLHSVGNLGIRYSAQQLYEDLESTALVFGDYNTRARSRVVLLPTYALNLAGSAKGEERTLTTSLGASFEDSNRSKSRVSPLAEFRVEQTRGQKDFESVSLSISQTMQLPGFTAINSNPASGLFRGNQNLKETLSTSYEVSTDLVRGPLAINTALFYRMDDNLVDWTYTENVQPFAARTANNVDIKVTGVELTGRYEWRALTFQAGYYFLHKESNYGVDIDASFYALNFPRHRVTSALNLRYDEFLNFRFDIEWREQEPNSLRSSSDRTYSIGALSASYVLPGNEWLEVSFIIDNVWNENFEEVPGVPGLRRSAGIFLTGRF